MGQLKPPLPPPMGRAGALAGILQRLHHLPGALVVKEEDKKELLSSLGLLLLSQLQHVQWRDRDGDTIVQEALPGHLGIDDLEAEKETGSEQGRMGEAIKPTIKALKA